MTQSTKPFYSAAAQNCEPVYRALEKVFRDHHSILEVGSGTGQQAAYFCERLPALQWFTSDLASNHAGILAWIRESNCSNLHGPLLLDVTQSEWPDVTVDAVYASNVVHLMNDHEIRCLFSGVATRLPEHGCFYLYGPFKVSGEFLSETDRQFDENLRGKDAGHGLRSVDVLEKLASECGLSATEPISMPENNQILCWHKPA